VPATRVTNTSVPDDDGTGGRSSGWLRLLVFASLLTLPVTVFGNNVNLRFESIAGGVLLSGVTTNPIAATLAFGNISPLGPLAPGVQRTVDATSFTVSSPVGVRVFKNGLPSSSSYRLNARLTAAHPLTVQVNSQTLSTASIQVDPIRDYGITYPYTIALRIPRDQSSGPVSVGIELTAMAN
jgi:hypothetical protein